MELFGHNYGYLIGRLDLIQSWFCDGQARIIIGKGEHGLIIIYCVYMEATVYWGSRSGFEPYPIITHHFQS